MNWLIFFDWMLEILSAYVLSTSGSRSAAVLSGPKYMGALKRTVCSHNPTLSAWWKTILPMKRVIFSQSHFPLVPLKLAFFHLPLPLAQIWFHSVTPSYRFEWPPSLQPAYITNPVPYPTHFNPEDESSMFQWNIGICLQDQMVSQSEDHNLDIVVLSFKHQS
jgi:hypothetical protein